MQNQQVKETALKKVLEKAGYSLGGFQKLLQSYGLQLSRSSTYNLINNGSIPKRINGFNEKFTAIIEDNFRKELQIMKIEKNKILDEVSTKNLRLGGNMVNAIYLSQDAKHYFKLKSDPFAPYLSKLSDIIMLQSHYYADEIIKSAASAGLFAVITGEVGSGKTTVRDKFLEENKIGSHFIAIIPESKDASYLNAREIMSAIVYELSEDKPKRSMEALSRQVKKLLKQRQASGEKCVLLIDEAQDLHTNTLKYLKRLWEMRNGLTALIGIVLIGQPELETRLYGQSNAEVREVTARTTHAKLEPINKELKQYLTHKIKQAGSNIDNVITDDAIELLSKKLTLQDRNNKVQQVAYPLETGNIMKLLMNKAVMSGEELITAGLVESINL